MNSTGDAPDTGRNPWATAAETFAAFFLGSLLYRLIVHLTGWHEYTLGESVVFALFMGCLTAMVMPLIDRSTTRRS
ncbi:hypothetical protein [Arsenicicoccus dermatophilus]|uniref:hypothetical protein n=1 Tax=Arsenicicoccus dermatophilus TaxID=1076331 RepID=UPI003916F1E8